MTQITHLNAREILDSRGNPTLEVDVHTTDGHMGRASVPSGASTGSHEACELRDGDPKRYKGKGVTCAMSRVHQEIASALKGYDVTDQAGVDACLVTLDGTPQKSHLGANATLAVSLAVARAAANVKGEPLFRSLGGADATLLPRPMMNIINGGAHADNGIDIQEFMIIPTSATTMATAIQYGAEIFHALKARLHAAGHATNVGDEGGFAPDLPSTQAALDCICLAIGDAGFKVGVDVHLALDAAANEFFKDGTYHLEGRTLTTDELVDFYEDLVRQYPIVSIEDGLEENDFEGWSRLTKRLGGRVQIVGDDLFVTNSDRLQKGITMHSANAILIKPNQIGTLSQTLQTISMAQSNGWATIISHRSGETEDTFIADLAVATAAGQIKTGSLSRTDRVAKYNQLLRIAEVLGVRARYAHIPFGPTQNS